MWKFSWLQENGTVMEGSFFCLEIDLKAVCRYQVPAYGHDHMPCCQRLHFFVVEMDGIGGDLFVHL